MRLEATARHCYHSRPGKCAGMPSWDVRFDLRVDETDAELLRAVYGAEATAKMVQGIPLKPRIRDQFDQMNIMRAVRGTTAIEGSDLSEADVQRVIDAPAGKSVLSAARSRQEREAKNAARVMVFIADTLNVNPAEPLTQGLVCQLHELMTEGIDYENNEPGKYRSFAVHAGTYRPPVGLDNLKRLMAEFIDWLNSPFVQHLPTVLRVAAAHFYFISVHPFGDGNGRTARAIESYLLYQGGINKLGFYSLANFYYQNRAEYEAMLDYTRFQSNGTLNPFLRFAASGLRDELGILADAVLRENKKVAFHDYMYDIVGHHKMRPAPRQRLFAILETLVKSGPVLLEDVRSRKHPLGFVYEKLSNQTLARDVAWLIQHNLATYASDGRLQANIDVLDTFTVAGDSEPRRLPMMQYRRLRAV